jgi:hypothetical protein
MIMASAEQNARVYQDLASIYVQQGQAQMRDRFLVLAADAMNSAGRADEAENLRQRLLQVNPHHLFKPFRSVAEALKSGDVKNYVEGLRRTYPPEKAVQLLESARAGKGDKADVKTPPPLSAPTVSNAGVPAEKIKIFGFQEEVRPTTSHTTPTRASSGARWAAPAAPSPSRLTPGDADHSEANAGAWVAAGLFWILLLAALALAIHTFGRPFLPL